MKKFVVNWLIRISIAIVVMSVIALVLIKKDGSPISPTSMSPSSHPSPSPHVLSPTLIPPQPFTGVEVNQELPIEIKTIGEQKTALRRQTPLSLPLGTIEFNFQNDSFTVRLHEPKDENRALFDSWKTASYPALTDDKFAFQ